MHGRNTTEKYGNGFKLFTRENNGIKKYSRSNVLGSELQHYQRTQCTNPTLWKLLIHQLPQMALHVTTPESNTPMTLIGWQINRIIIRTKYKVLISNFSNQLIWRRLQIYSKGLFENLPLYLHRGTNLNLNLWMKHSYHFPKKKIFGCYGQPKSDL